MARESKVVPVLLTPHGEYFTFLERFAELVRADQREIDAKVCETHAPTTTPTWVSYAAAIRARK